MLVAAAAASARRSRACRPCARTPPQPTHGRRGLGRRFAISSTNCDSSFSSGSDSAGTERFFSLNARFGITRRQVAVAGPLAVSVDRALHVRRAGLDGRQRVGDAEADVVVRVDADRGRERARARRRVISAISAGIDPPLVSHSTTMSAPAAFGGLPASPARTRVVLVAVERVLGVVDDEPALRLRGSGPCRRSSRGSLRASSAALRGRAAATSCRKS